MYDDYVRGLMGQTFKHILKGEPVCNSCRFRKVGVSTICEQYKRIPSSVQQGGFCERRCKKE